MEDIKIILNENDDSNILICDNKELKDALWRIIDLNNIAKCGIKKEKITPELFKIYQKLSEIFDKNFEK